MISARDNPCDDTANSLKTMNAKILEMSQKLQHLQPANPVNSIVINSCRNGHSMLQTSSTQTDQHPGDPVGVQHGDTVHVNPVPQNETFSSQTDHHTGGHVEAHLDDTEHDNPVHLSPDL